MSQVSLGMLSHLLATLRNSREQMVSKSFPSPSGVKASSLGIEPDLGARIALGERTDAVVRVDMDRSDSSDDATALFGQADGSTHPCSCLDPLVDDEYTLSRKHRIVVQFQRFLCSRVVYEHSAVCEDGELALLADRDEACPSAEGKCAAQDEPKRVDPRNDLEAERLPYSDTYETRVIQPVRTGADPAVILARMASWRT